mmetsp:Transcript_4589/g.13564  ORF Transcript_4589/g.13564 Transcript_4589/m.13564 type:complete len:263 (+) Transcript_4589:909-1697(+)
MVVQLDAQRLRHQLQHADAVLRLGLRPDLEDVLRVAGDPHNKVLRDAILHEVAPKDGRLLIPLVPQEVELRHLGGQDAEEDRAGPVGRDEDYPSIDVLCEALGRDLVHATRKLRECPPERHDVPDVQILMHKPRGRKPVLALRPVPAKEVPDAGYQVARAQHDNDQLRNVRDNYELLGGQPLGQQIHDLPDLRQAQQPDHAQDAEGTASLAHLGRLYAVRAEDKLQPVHGDNQYVQEEPSLDVLLRNPPGVPVDGPVRRHIP